MVNQTGIKADNKHALVRDVVHQIPHGRVASYGMVASLCAGVTPRLVGFVMAGIDPLSDVPWQRVINASGGISPRPGSDRQRQRLLDEGVSFNRAGKIDWGVYAWDGPDIPWLQKHGIDPETAFFLKTNWPQYKN